MRYIERDPLIVNQKYNTSLKEFNVSIRGTNHRDNIFFKQDDILALLNLPSKTHPKDVAWVDTKQGRSLYISYDSLVDLYRIKSKNGCSSTSNSFRFMFLINTILDDDSCSELDDSENSFSIDSDSESEIYNTNGYLLELINEYKNTIDALAALLHIKDSTIRTLREENQQLRLMKDSSSSGSFTSYESINDAELLTSEGEAEWV